MFAGNEEGITTSGAINTISSYVVVLVAQL